MVRLVSNRWPLESKTKNVASMSRHGQDNLANTRTNNKNLRYTSLSFKVAMVACRWQCVGNLIDSGISTPYFSHQMQTSYRLCHLTGQQTYIISFNVNSNLDKRFIKMEAIIWSRFNTEIIVP